MKSILPDINLAIPTVIWLMFESCVFLSFYFQHDYIIVLSELVIYKLMFWTECLCVFSNPYVKILTPIRIVFMWILESRALIMRLEIVLGTSLLVTKFLIETN